MPSNISGNLQPQLDLSEHDETGGVDTKRVLNYLWDTTNLAKVRATGNSQGQMVVALATTSINATITVPPDVNLIKLAGVSLSSLGLPLLGGGGAAAIKDDTAFGNGVTSGVLSVHSRIYNPATSSYDRQSFGATVMASSLPVTFATNQTALSVSAAQSSRATATLTAGLAANTTVTSYSQVTVTIRGTYAGATVVFEYTDDGSNYYPISGARADTQVSGSTITLTNNSTVSFNIPVGGATSFRVRCSALTSGALVIGLTATGDQFFPTPSVSLNAILGNAISTVAAGVAMFGIADSAGNAFLSAANALNSTGAGLQAAQNVAQFDDVSPTTITENQFGNLRMSNDRILYVGGNIAHGTADSGNPLKVGAKAASTFKTATPVATGSRTDNQSDLDGALLTRNGAPLGDLISERITINTNTSTAFLSFASIASTRSYIRGYSIINPSATACYVDFRDGTGGSVLWSVPVPAASGANAVQSEPIFRGSLGTVMAYQVSASTATIIVSVTGFLSRV